MLTPAVCETTVIDKPQDCMINLTPIFKCHHTLLNSPNQLHNVHTKLLQRDVMVHRQGYDLNFTVVVTNAHLEAGGDIPSLAVYC